MLPAQDQQMISQIVKEFEETPYSHDFGFLYDILLGGDVRSLERVIRDDDGKIDFSEDNLFRWYIEQYEDKMRYQRDFHRDVEEYFFNYLDSKR